MRSPAPWHCLNYWECPQSPDLNLGTYIDLIAATPREFTATGSMEAGRGHRYVPKSEVPYELCNRLIGVKNVIRTGISERE
jgi:hypothetical protein